jgi:hypothetical protein
MLTRLLAALSEVFSTVPIVTHKSVTVKKVATFVTQKEVPIEEVINQTPPPSSTRLGGKTLLV